MITLVDPVNEKQSGFVDFPFTHDEENILINYCYNDSREICKKFLMSYYVHHGRVVEAIRLHESLKFSDFSESVFVQQGESMIEKFKRDIPHVQRIALEIELESTYGMKNRWSEIY